MLMFVKLHRAKELQSLYKFVTEESKNKLSL